MMSARDPPVVVFEVAVPAGASSKVRSRPVNSVLEGNSMASPLTTVVSSRRVLYMGFKTLALAAFLAKAAFAQNIAGTWQGTLQTPQRALRLVMKVTRADDESLKAMFYSIDQNGQGIPAS